MSFSTRLFDVARSVVPSYESGKIMLPGPVPIQIILPELPAGVHLPTLTLPELALPELALPKLSLTSLPVVRSLPAPAEVIEPLLGRLQATGEAIGEYELPPLLVLELAMLIACAGLATVLLILAINKDLAEW